MTKRSSRILFRRNKIDTKFQIFRKKKMSKSVSCYTFYLQSFFTYYVSFALMFLSKNGRHEKQSNPRKTTKRGKFRKY